MQRFHMLGFARFGSLDQWHRASGAVWKDWHMVETTTTQCTFQGCTCLAAAAAPGRLSPAQRLYEPLHLVGQVTLAAASQLPSA
jgi:hypothetical protein